MAPGIDFFPDRPSFSPGRPAVRRRLVLLGPDAVGEGRRRGWAGSFPAPGVVGGLAALGQPLHGEGSLGHGALAVGG